MDVPILISPFFIDYILPLVLVFTLIFAILQKTEVLGTGKKQIDSIVALVIGLMLIAFPFARKIVVEIMPFLAVCVAILLVFMLLYGFVYQGKVDLHRYLKWTFMTIIGIALIIVLVYITGSWNFVYELLFGGEGRMQIWINVLILVIIAGAIIAVIKGDGKTKD
jgi:hypothetical protein